MPTAGLTRDDIPTVISEYLDAHVVRDADRVTPLFWPDATVTDEGATRTGIDAIRIWIETGASEYTYTTTETGYALPTPDHVQVFARIEGNFPGGLVDVVYDFRLRDGKIASLVID
jgi:hypothetical protein